jgi:hypothetical protein
VAFTEEQLVRLDRAFSSIHANDSLMRAVVGNRCLFLRAFQNPVALGARHFPKVRSVVMLEVYDAIGLTAREGAIFLDHMEECLRIAQLPAFQRPAAIEAEESRYQHREKGSLLGLVDTRSMPVMMIYGLRRVAQLEMAKVLLAVERYRLARASLPETLDQLVPAYVTAVPADPFNGTPLRYKGLDRGFLVYSVGEDGRDDGGKQEPQKVARESGESWDLVFRVERQ